MSILFIKPVANCLTIKRVDEAFVFTFDFSHLTSATSGVDLCFRIPTPTYAIQARSSRTEPVLYLYIRCKTCCSSGGLSQKAEQDTCRNGRTDNTSYVGTHSVHQEEVATILLLTLLLRNTSSHRYGAHTSRTNEGVNL